MRSDGEGDPMERTRTAAARPRWIDANRAIRALVAALVAATIGASPAFAADPTNGGSRGNFTSNDTITYDWRGGPPTYVKNAFIDALESKYPDPDTNNSKAPTFVGPSSNGTAKMHWAALDDSPCAVEPNPQWLQYARNWGTTSLEIFVRDLESSEGAYSNWHWWDTGSSCPTSNCWYLRRAMIHEIGHAALSLDHDGAGEGQTVMASTSPEYSDAGGQHTRFQRCDMARAQLLWDLEDKAGAYADCYESLLSGHSELRTQLTVAETTIYVCKGGLADVSGRLQVRDLTEYGRLGGNALAGRVVRFDRNGSPNCTSTTATTGTGDNWGRSFSGSGTISWVAHYDSGSATDGLESSSDIAFTTIWSSAECP